MQALDLFAGAGGWDVAAARLGITAHGVENMPAARATRDAAGLSTIHDDVWTLGDALDALVTADPDSVAFARALQIASPPCQTFSAAGKGAGRKALDDVLRAIDSGAYRDLARLRGFGAYVGDERTALVLTPLHFAVKYLPDAIAWEQVPTVMPVWEACADVLRAEGYDVWTGLLHAEQYGVPQTRKRALLLASRVRPVAPPVPTHSRYYPRTPTRLDLGVDRWVSMAEALGAAEPFTVVSNYGTGGDPAARGERTSDQPAHTVTGKGTAAWRLQSPQSVAGGERATRDADEPSVTVTANFDRARWCETRDDLPELTHNRPSTTIVGSFKPEVVAAPGYRTTVSRQNAPDSVRVTVAEAAVLQSFPADHPWQGAKGKQYLQVGNAIPPLLAQHSLAAVTGLSVTTTDTLPSAA